MALAIRMAAVPMPLAPAWTRIVSPGCSLALSKSICSTVPKVTGARRRLGPADALGHRHGWRIRGRDAARQPVAMETHDRPGDVLAEIVRPAPAGAAMAAESARHRSRPHLPRRRSVTPSPSAAISPAASTPTTMGSLRLAKAMPRQPQTSMWLSATACIRTSTSPAPGRGLRHILQLEAPSSIRRRACMGHQSKTLPRQMRRVGSSKRVSGGAEQEADVLAAEAEGIGQHVLGLAGRASLGTTSSGDGRVRRFIVDRGRQQL